MELTSRRWVVGPHQLGDERLQVAIQVSRRPNVILPESRQPQPSPVPRACRPALVGAPQYQLYPILISTGQAAGRETPDGAGEGGLQYLRRAIPRMSVALSQL